MESGPGDLTLEEGGFVLGAALAHRNGDFARRALAEPGASRCGAALDRLAAAAQPARAAGLASLMALARAPVPAGLGRVHPEWLRERLDREPTSIVREVTTGLGPTLERLGGAILWERGEGPPRPAPRLPDQARRTLQRMVFGGVVPLEGPGAPRGPLGRRMLELDPDALDGELRRRGAEILGASLRGAAKETIARAATAAGPELAPVLLEGAARAGSREERDAARDLVAAADASAGRDLFVELGLRALAVALAAEGASALEAVAQRMPLATGRRLCAAARPPGDGEA